MDTSTTQNTTQGFRFYKSGSTSPVPPSNPPHRVPSNPSLISESGESPSFLQQQLRRTNSFTSSSSSLAVDPKLLQIVKRITTSTPSLLIASAGGNKASQQARNNNITAVTNLVLDKHREYKRKDISWVRSGVEGALSVLATESAGSAISSDTNSNKKRRAPTTIPIGGGSNISSNPSTGSLLPNSSASQKKKRLESADEDTSSLMDEDNSDLDIADEKNNNNNPHENITPNPNETSIISRTNSGGMLNASLRNNYKNVQREREREAAAAATSANDASAAPADDGTNDASSVVATPSEGNEKSSSIAQGSKTPTASVTTPKRKKKSSKKAPSSSRTQDISDDNPYSTSTPSTLVLPSPRPTERYSNLGGMAPLLQQVRELIEYPLSRPELFLHLGVEPPRGVLLRGPPGCGKTHLAKAISGELNVSYFQVSSPELVGGVSGESELRVRTLFESAANYAPAIIFIDEIDAIAPKRGEGAGGGGKSMEKRIVAQLLTSMDSIHPKNNRNASAVIVLGATNRPDAMDPALRRAGRFDREIVLGAPDEAAREGILQVMTSQMRVEGSLDYKVLARKTPGFVGADLRSLTKEAAVIAIKRIFRMDLLGGSGHAEKQDDNVSNDATARDTPEESSSNDINSIVPLTPEQLSPLYITMEDFLAAIPHVQPSSKREGFTTVPDVSWDDIGALASIREELTLSVLEPISHPEKFEALGLPLPAGVLLYGPPGCGKTLLAKAIANESGANFISVKGPELLDKYVGESERSVRVVFERARSSSPCIIFFDELDSLCPKRGSDSGGGGGVSERVVNQLLTEMDGLDSRRSVFVIAATNRPELIDPAMLRPGRLDKLLYVPLPSPDDRYSILQALGASIKLAADVNLHTIAHDSRANGFSGADCAALLREAGLAVLRDGILGKPTPQVGGVEEGKESPPLQITSSHFQYAFDHVLPSVSKKDQARYDKLRDRMARARTRATTEANTVAAAPGVEDSNASDVEKGV
jgi:ribosome biogenesis ATPase